LHIFVPASDSYVAPVKPAVTAPASPKVTELAVTAIEPPVRLEITSLKVDAIVNQAGLTSSGNMDISENPDEVAWYRLGPKPGEIGSAVIAGHYGWKNSHGSIFNNLHTLTKGDEVSTYDQNGVKQTFIVQATQIYDPQADATKVFTSTDKKAHLNLVTCEGTWVNNKDSYSNRLVVFTDLK
jgi:LPXTG-site transpeptidase (sortase) family protein